MKTLFYTCFYSKLWGSEFGGRASRENHYKFSLYNILNLNPDKFVCFTSEEELKSLENFFYEEKKVPSDKLEFVVFELKNSKYYENIKKIKNLEEIKRSDRCFEIQYNKFFWIDLLKNLQEYDRLFWIDAGLSHGGIIPEKYSYGEGYEKHFNFNLFNQNYLKRICEKTNDKILLLSKNNSGFFYWSSTIPEKYYVNYSKENHIIGGMFGGTPKQMIEFKNRFENLLNDLLKNENVLYFEELIMSCLYFNFKKDFVVFEFDDWYDRKDCVKYGNYVKYFYNVLEIPNVCCASISIETNSNSEKYLKNSKKFIKTYLKYTNYDILLITNKKNFYDDLNNGRLIVLNYDDHFKENILSSNRFNMHLKRYPIAKAKDIGYDIIFYNDCDCYIDGWDEKSFNKKIEQDFDVFFVSHANPQLGGLRKSYKHFQDKIDIEFGGLYYEELDSAPNPAETRIIFKNNSKLFDFLEFWGRISENNKDYFTYYDGVYFGTSSIYAKMNLGSVTKNDEFSKYCYINHNDNILNYFGEKYEK